jgi:hypothetical protein
VKASLLWCRLLGGRVVNREDGLLGLLARFHLDVARDSLLFGHCCGCVWCMCMGEEVFGVVERRTGSSWAVSKLVGDEDGGYARRGKKMGRVQLAAILVPEDL